MKSHCTCFTLITLFSFWIQPGCGGKSPSTAVPEPSTDVRATQDNTRMSTGQPAPVANDDHDEADQAKTSRAISLNQLLATGDWESAATILSERLVADPNDLEALFYLANVHASQGDLAKAIEMLSDIPPDVSEAGLAALGVAAGWCMELERFAEAEQRYRRILELAPKANMARRPLAYIYNRRGRRHEAVQLIRQLCASGDVTLDELHALMAESDAMYDAPGTEPSANTRPYWPIGRMGQARFEFAERRFAEAAALVEPLLRDNTASPSTIAFYGLAIVEAQNEEQFAWWLGKVREDVKRFPEYWAAIGTHLMNEGSFEEALRALAEALTGNPTDVRSTRRVIQGFRSLGNQAMADQWAARYELLTNTIRLSVQVAEGRSDLTEDLAEHLRQLNRTLEAVMWAGVQAASSSNHTERIQVLNAERLTVLKQNRAFPSRRDTLGDWNFNQHPLPSVESNRLTELTVGSTPTTLNERPALESPMAARFRNHSVLAGLDFRYRVNVRPQDHAFALYQQNGGGAAAVDYDLDGRPDLYFAQGAAAPPEFIAGASDQLFRNLPSPEPDSQNAGVVVDVTLKAGVQENAYTLGVTGGDWNQDGFPDLAVANIGTNVLLINQGDGTFRPSPLNEHSSKKLLSTSLAIGDINGDHLPDLYVLNYLNDAGIATTPRLNARGEALAPVSQHDFNPAHDDVWFGTADGTTNYEVVGGRERDSRYGLGVVLTNITTDLGNELFVGNDGGANQLWAYDQESSRWIDSAIVCGCAFGSTGSPTASMGIAAADLDGSGSLDFHVTNFYNESSCLYLQAKDQLRELNIKFGIDRSSYSVLGFGTQAIDVANDGNLELIVGNGHIENLESTGLPFRQPMQLLQNRGGRFDAVSVDESSVFWDRPHLTRCLIRLDFDRDGRADVIATDLLDPAAILMNETETSNHWIGLRLVGTKSERDAIGAEVQVQVRDRSLHGWVTTGDGYLGKNENTLLFGLGDHTEVKQVLVKWPTGSLQTFDSIPVDQYSLLVEGDPASAFELTSAMGMNGQPAGGK